ncbi:uncharacterized protein LOC108679555 isoform X2 [Hyalella azteca]|uniref:Uncharacterized protein LOC108679555 isoform X1 n=1 Tax=Hyalella azteca TaxID=294128 RepID=A0A8B7PEG3_HYAAZ|nr:uncharacterized protein LOC108679555 isoform X1 [Hyalella azteca]XP_047736903.1 uncharacterized protein LOC108679555 isoform X2 [Hyalella azteca]
MASAATTTSAPHCDFQEMETLYQNYYGIMELCPKYVGKILCIECGDKNPTETYKEYLERLWGQSFTQTEWKKMSGNKSMASSFETDTTSDDMDMTTLFKLFQMIFEMKKNDGRDPAEVIEKLKAVKDVRNDMMHNEQSMKDPSRIIEIEERMKKLIQKSGEFYNLPDSETRLMEYNLQVEIKSGPTSAGKKLAYHIHRLLIEGKKCAVRRFQDFTEEDLPFDVGRVDRSDVFYSPEITLKDEENNRFEYQAMFNSSDKIVIVLGEAGAGKTTLLKNIILQFIEMSKSGRHFLDDFELLVHIECRNRTVKNLQQVFVGLFGRVCFEIGEDCVLQALSRLRVLFLVDAFDEHNAKSITVLRELFQGTWDPSSRILITSRPSAVGKLRQFLAKNNCHFSEYVIAPLSQLEEQMNFIEKYEQRLNTDPAVAGMMPKWFSRLDPHIRSLFVTPMALLHYCAIHLRFPDNVRNWRSASDVSGDTLKLYRTILEEKLSDINVFDVDLLIDNLFVIIGKFALEFLVSDRITFTEDEFLLLKRPCHSEITSHCSDKDIKSDVLLSAMFSMRKSLSGNAGATYSFAHKSIQERSAAHYVKERMLNTGEPLLSILGVALETNASISAHRERQQLAEESVDCDDKESESVEQNNLEHFLEVFLYVLKELSSCCPPQFQRYWPQLRDAIAAAGVTRGADWQAVLLRSPDVTELGKHAAKITIEETDVWDVHTASDVAAVALMLPHQQPRLITVKLPAAVLRAAGTSWSDLVRLHRGQLKLFTAAGAPSPEPCDDLLECLKDSRCQLAWLDSCISSASDVDAVASVATATTELWISLPTPLNLHALQGNYKRLVVNIWPLDAAWSAFLQSAQSPCQVNPGAEVAPSDAIADGVRLPPLPPPGLMLWGAEPGSFETIARVIRTIAPVSKRLGGTWLPNCDLGEDELRKLLAQLHYDGIRNAETSHTRYTKHPGGLVRLHVTDVPSDFDGATSSVCKILARLQSSGAGDFEVLWPEWRRAMEEARASARDWREALLCRPCEERLAATAAQATRKEDGQFMITSGRDLDAVALMLPHAEDTTVKVEASPVVLRTPTWQQIVSQHNGRLQLHLPLLGSEFQSCDDLLQPLAGSRSKIVRFESGISTAAGVAALSAAAVFAQLLIRLEAPLSLGPLLGKYSFLAVYTAVINPAVAAVPLPASPPTWLYVLGAAAGSWEAVAQTVTTFAPSSKRYGTIILQESELSAEDEGGCWRCCTKEASEPTTQAPRSASSQVMAYDSSTFVTILRMLAVREKRSAGSYEVSALLEPMTWPKTNWPPPSRAYGLLVPQLPYYINSCANHNVT